ncbi:MAG: SGNH/GDSL hydrolase family protein, partial [Candidatus Omnitrophica bacterium]|nr:SGNH/GDSL hydrolase family protein [Candidatus Omnitrophota bacterium]
MKKTIFIFVSILLGIVFGLLSLELFFRLTPKFGVSYNSFRFESKDSPMLKAMNSYEKGVYRPSSLLGYELVPSLGRINSHGLVGREYNFFKNNGTHRILLLGDSIAAQDWSREFLEAALNGNQMLSSKHKFEVWNAGVPGYDVHHYALYLINKGIYYKPDMVMIFLCLNDFNRSVNIYYKNKDGITEYTFPNREISKRYSVSPFFMRYSYLYRFAILRINNYLLSRKIASGVDPREEDGKYFMQEIKEICEKNNIKLFLTVFPYFKPKGRYSSYQREEYQIICKVLKDLKLDYLDLSRFLPEKDLYGLREKEDDEIHPSR